MSAFTPGPWRLNDGREWFTRVLDKGGHTLCTLGGGSVEPDARLMVAAPEMYELLRDKRLRDAAGVHGEQVLSEIDALLARIDGSENEAEQ